MTATITNVSFPADGRPVISLRVTERHGYGVKDLSTAAVTWRFALLKLVPGIAGTTGGVNGSANDTWVSYMAANDHTSASSETAAAANLTDHGDGTYDYKLAKVINGGAAAAGTTYDAAATHRLIVLLYASGNPFAPINLVKELVPATGADVTGQNDKVDGKACLECHTSFRAITGGTGEFGSGEFHGGVRYDIRTCVACHNDQRRFSSAGAALTEPAIAADGTWTGTAAVINREAVINLPVYIHKIHMGNKLTLTGGTYQGVPQPYETTYPQDIRNCAKCHRATGAPGRQLEGQAVQPGLRRLPRQRSASTPPSPPAASCTPAARRPNDAGCSTCHRPGGPGGDTAAWHTPVSPPNPHNIFADATSAGNANTNAAYVAAAGAVPPGAGVIKYVVNSVSTWTDTANGNVLRPQIAFKFQLDGKDVVLPDPSTASEMHPGLRRLAERVLRLRRAAGRDQRAGRLQRLGQRVPPEHLERHRDLLERGGDHHPHRGGDAHRAGRQRLLHRPAEVRDRPGERDDVDRRHRLHLRARLAPEPVQPGSRLRQQHAAVHADQPARLSLQAKPQGRRRHARLRRGGRAHRAAARRVDGRHRLHRPARDRRQLDLQHLPRHAGRRPRLPRRPAQRRQDLQLVPPPESDEQRLVGATRRTSSTPSTARPSAPTSSPGTRSRPPRASGRRPIPASSTTARCATCRGRTTSARPRPPAPTPTCWPAPSARGPTRPAACTPPSSPRRRTTASGSATTPSPARRPTPIRPPWSPHRSWPPASPATTRRSPSTTCRPTAARSTSRGARRSPSRSRRSACSVTAPAASPPSPTLHAFMP